MGESQMNSLERYSELMSTSTEPNEDNFEGFEVAVGTDGALTLPADELA